MKYNSNESVLELYYLRLYKLHINYAIKYMSPKYRACIRRVAIIQPSTIWILVQNILITH